MFGDYITSRRKGSDARHPRAGHRAHRARHRQGEERRHGARVPRQAKLGVVKFAGKQKFSKLPHLRAAPCAQGQAARRRGEEQAGPDRGRRGRHRAQHRADAGAGRRVSPAPSETARPGRPRRAARRAAPRGRARPRAGTAPPSRAAGRGEPDPGPPRVEPRRGAARARSGARCAPRRSSSSWKDGHQHRALVPDEQEGTALGRLVDGEAGGVVETPRSRATPA